MVISGSNFFPESKVIFLEKGPGKFVHTPVQHGRTKVMSAITCHDATLIITIYRQCYFGFVLTNTHK